MINWILFVEDVEDVACTVDDMEARNRSGSLVYRDVTRGGGTGARAQAARAEMKGVPVASDTRLPHSHLRHLFPFQALPVYRPPESTRSAVKTVQTG